MLQNTCCSSSIKKSKSGVCTLPVQLDSGWDGILRLKHSAAWEWCCGVPDCPKRLLVPIRRAEDP